MGTSEVSDHYQPTRKLGQFSKADEALEEQDRLPSLPSASSSLFIASPAHSVRRRTSSLYGNPSVSKSDAISIEGCSTFEYDINSNIHKQQARRRRGDSNASISTVVSCLSHTNSVADSMQSYNDRRRNRLKDFDDDDRSSVLARGQFISNQNSSASIGKGGDGNDFYSSSAAASLRRIRKTSGMNIGDLNEALSRRGQNKGVAGMADSGPHLTDNLERMIANSTIYKAVHARQLPNSTSNDPYNSSFAPRQRKLSYASMRSLIGFTSTAQRQTGDYHAVGSGPPSRTASLFGLFIGGGAGPANSGSQTSRGYSGLTNGQGTLRSPTWTKPSASIASTTTISAIPIDKDSSIQQSAMLTKSSRDALGSLRGIRGLSDDSNLLTNHRRRTNSAFVRPALKSALTANSIFDPQSGRNSIDTNRDGSKEDDTPQSSIRKRPEGKRRVSFQSHSRQNSNSDMKGSMPDVKQLSIKQTNSSTNVRRAFMSIDPTSGATYGSGNNSPRTIGSVTPPLNNGSRNNSQLSLSSMSKQSTNGNSSMPPLDEALALAEDRSGLKTSSKCSMCDKKVVNAPVSKSGEVFCGRDCRMTAKEKRKGKMVSRTMPAKENESVSSLSSIEARSNSPNPTANSSSGHPKAETSISTIQQESVRKTDSFPVEDVKLSSSTFKPAQPLQSSRPSSIATTRSASSNKFFNTDVENFRAVQAQAKASNPVVQVV